MPSVALEKRTGALFEKLWAPYDGKLFEESVKLFTRRLDLLNFDSAWLKDKVVLDAGCGGGRNTIAMARLGAAQAHGIDLGREGLANARERSASLPNAHFQHASLLDIPFADETFDMVWCAGVLMITDDEDRALDELTRVCKPSGLLYLLVYADEGMRWPLINTLRPIAHRIGRTETERAMKASGMPANKRRTFLDDLFCPKLDFYNWDRLRRMLERRGFTDIQRWSAETRLDHEHSLEDYRADLSFLLDMFVAGARPGFAAETTGLFEQGASLIRAVIDTVRWFETEVDHERMNAESAMELVIGQGHHRVLATKGA